MIDWAIARRNMVNNQVRTNGVTDPRLIDALMRVPRERFVPAEVRALAYCDEDIPLNPGGGETPPRHLIEPMVVARMIQLAEIRATDLVLDVGCATGYSSAVIAQLAGSVVALEESDDLADRAQETLVDTGIDNVAVVRGPLAAGYPSQSPYDVIAIEGAVDEVPNALFDQLGDGGRLVAVVRGGALGRTHVFLKQGSHIGHRAVFDAAVPLLPGFQRARGFEFQAE